MKRSLGSGTRRSLNLALALGMMGLTAPLACQSSEEGPSEDGSGGEAGSDPGASGGKGSGASAGTGGRAATGGSKTSGGAPSTGGKGASGGSFGGEPGAGGRATGGAAGEGPSGTGGEGGAAEIEPCAGVLSEDECDAIDLLAPLNAVPPDPTNAYADDAAAAELGQMFFFDADFSGKLVIDSDLGLATESGKVSCASCHGSPMMSDDRSLNDANVSLGANFHSRNAPAIINSSFYRWTNWGGRFSRAWELPMPVTESGVIMNSSRLQVAHIIYDQYKDEYETVFGAAFGPLSAAIAGMPATGKPGQTEWDGLSDPEKTVVTRVFVNYAKAIAAYTRLLVSRNGRFDQFVAGDYEALDAAEVRGLQVFLGPGQCTSCHSGSHFSDDSFHNIGVAQTGPNVPLTDNGRITDLATLLGSSLNAAGAYSDAPEVGQAQLAGLSGTDEALRGVFRTPTLRGLADTAPYMHAGQLATLEEVVEFYDRGGDTPSVGTKSPLLVPLGLTTEQKADLVSFLLTLSGDAVPEALLEDTSH